MTAFKSLIVVYITTLSARVIDFPTWFRLGIW